MEKEKNIWIIPTNKPSSVGYDGDNNLHFVNMFITDYQNIYITSNKEYSSYCLKECPMAGLHIDRCDCKIFTACTNKVGNIILTTDQELIDDGVGKIDDTFLEVFVRNPNCDEVKIHKYGKDQSNEYTYFYELKYPKEKLEEAKWHQERSYSEEEVGELIYNIFGEYGKHYDIMIDGEKLNNLFEQFKKK